MKNKSYDKGMTLVEIIIVLLISTILMMVVGVMVLNSIGFFQRETVNDNNKYITDSISSLIREKILYATEVEISTKNQGMGWEYFSVNENGHLCLNGEELYNEDFYKGKKLDLSARIFQSNRMDVITKLLDNGEQVYKTSNTMNMVNIDEVKVEDGKEVTQSGLGTETTKITEETGYRIYFIIGVKHIINADEKPEPEPPITEEPEKTTDYEIKCMNEDNNKGAFDAKKAYKIGDFVYYPPQENTVRTWYRATTSIGIGTSIPKSDSRWKKINGEWDASSIYRYGDIVKYNGLYYQVQTLEVSANSIPGTNSGWSLGFPKIFEVTQATRIKPSYMNCPCYMTVGDEIFEKTPSNDKGMYMNDGSPQFNLDDFVYVMENGVKQWYRSMINNNDSAPGLSVDGNTKWKRIDKYWNGRNSYEIGDIIEYKNKEGKSQFYKAVSPMYGEKHKVEPGTNKEYWELLTKGFNACGVTTTDKSIR